MQKEKTSIENELINLIESTKSKIKEFNLLENHYFNLNLWLDLIKICVEKKLFFACCVQMRSYRNAIYSFIKENIILAKYTRIITKYSSYKPYEGLIDSKYIHEAKPILEEINHLLRDVGEPVNWEAFDEKIEELEKANLLYHKIPTYLDNDLEKIDLSGWEFDEDEVKILRKLDRKVINYIKRHFLITKNNIELLYRSDFICNNGVHKNNYDSEDFDGNVYYFKNESVILKEMFEIYTSVLLKAVSNLKKQ